MGVARFTASADNTITNAFKSDLTTRGTGSSMGLSDILETFSIYGQANSSSAEKSRILINFPMTPISSSRVSGSLPESGSVSFYLRMYNAEHAQTLPRDYTLEIKAISGSWEEGFGLDMDGYTDETNNSTGSNWVNANGNDSKATVVLTANSRTAGQANTRQLTVVDADGTSVTFTIDNSTDTSTATIIAFSNANSNRTQFGINTAAAINASALRITATAAGSLVTLESDVSGRSGSSIADPSGTAITDGCLDMQGSSWSGGDGAWASEGGDYWGTDDVSSSFSASFPVGNEDLELDVTSLVEQWMQDVTGSTGKPNHGFAIAMSSSHESDSRSFYTKKFFGRGSEFFFKRPALEARWDSSYRDDRNNFYLSSSVVPAEENLNTLFLYNYVRGQLRDIPTITNNGHQIFVSVFSGNAENTALSGTALLLSVGGGVSNNTTALTSVATGTRIDTGIYTASLALTGTSGSATLTNLFDVWWTGSTTNPLAAAGLHSATVYRTGSVNPKTFDSFNIHPSTEYVTSIVNLKPAYSRNEKARFRTFTRTKDWSPTIYNKATTDVEMTIPDSASFSVYRIIDDLEVISHGTGSRKRDDLRGNKGVYADDNETVMSFDVSGSYFDINMDMLEPGYAYGIKFSYYNGGLGSWVEQPERFKFRVE